MALNLDQSTVGHRCGLSSHALTEVWPKVTGVQNAALADIVAISSRHVASNSGSSRERFTQVAEHIQSTDRVSSGVFE